MSTEVWGMDPGTQNCGYTIISATAKNFKILEIGMFESTFKNITENIIYKKITKAARTKAKKDGVRLTKKDMPNFPPLSIGYPIYYNSVNQLLKDYPTISHMVAERFQTRGNMGPVIEMVSMQLGTCLTLCHQQKIAPRLIIASQWKNAINKIIDLEDMYAYAHQYGITPHECDSTGMCLYQADHLKIIPMEISLTKWRKALSTYMKSQ